MKMFDISRKKLFEMKTAELYDLNNQITSLQRRIEAELVARGDF